MRLQGRVAVVTGAGSGFGEGIARRFAGEGARVVVNDLRPEGGERVAAAIRAEHGAGSAVFVQGNVSSNEDVRALVEQAVARMGRVDTFVNNAGTTHRNQPMLEVSEEWFDRIFAVNVKSIYLSALHVVPVFRRQGGGGSILNVASTAGLRPRPGLTVYNASKGAAITLTKSMAVEFAPDRIRVNCLCPVAGETPLLAEFMGADTPENRAKFVASIPLGRLSQSLDIANAALFLASDEAEFLTGVALEVDGGRCV
jgi:3-oxoacyl-[acyl-carrier protein] reductase